MAYGGHAGGLPPGQWLRGVEATPCGMDLRADVFYVPTGLAAGHYLAVVWGDDARDVWIEGPLREKVDAARDDRDRFLAVWGGHVGSA